ncbi:hypothetical protein ADK54_22345 [Streptomyces sp. WM6378]|nr:hypothetical protein ADK54_22345 [Streptomyces sp. WM6378]
MDSTVIRALARLQGIHEARLATAKLEASPTPPPQSTKRANAAKAPDAACGWLCAVSMIRPPRSLTPRNARLPMCEALDPSFLMMETLRCIHVVGNMLVAHCVHWRRWTA